MSKQKNILVLDDENDICELIKDILEDEKNFHVITSNNQYNALKIIQTQPIDLLLLDIWLENSNDGIEFLEQLKKDNYQFPIIMISGHGNVKTAVKAIKIGAYDYIEKPFPTDKLKIIVNNTIEVYQLKKKNTLRECLDDDLLTVVGSSDASEEVRDFIKKFAKTESRLLICGEKGTGKEFVARCIHRQSSHANQDFIVIGPKHEVVINNLSLEEINLNGTIFIDEVSKFPLYFQKSLLALINKLQFAQSNHNCRVIIACSEDLSLLTKTGQFNADLYNRLNVLTLELKPLRKRLKDIEDLCEIFAKHFYKVSGIEIKKFDSQAILKLQTFDWPGNIAQLKNIIEVVLLNNIYSEEEYITPEMLNIDLFGLMQNNLQNQYLQPEYFLNLKLRQARELFEKNYILMQLKRFEGSITKTAEFIGMDRSALHRKLKCLEIEFVE